MSFSSSRNSSFFSISTVIGSTASSGEFLKSDEKRRFNERNRFIKFTSETIPAFEKRIGRSLEKDLLNLAEDAWGIVAGGAVMSSIIGEYDLAKDIDLFFHSKFDFEDTVGLLHTTHKYDIDVDTLNTARSNPSSLHAILLNAPKNLQSFGKKPIQLVKMVWYENPFEVLHGFDLTCVQFAIWRDQVYFHHDSLDDLLNRRIVINRSLYPVEMIKRIKKYSDRGFKMADGSFDDLKNLFSQQQNDFVEVQPMKAPSTKTFELDYRHDKKGPADWNNPQFRKDYYNLDIAAFKRKWGTKW